MPIVTLAPWSIWILLVLRVVIGPLLMLHGYPKLTRERKQTEEFMKKTGMPPAMGSFGGFVEFFGGLAILVGLLTPLVALLMAIYMAVVTAFSITKLKKTLLTGLQPGYELDVLYILVLLTLAATGGGPISLDRLLKL